VSVRKVVLTSPAVWNGKVYIGFDGGLLFAFDTRNGKKLWAFEAGGPIRSSPAVSAKDGMLYFGCNDGRLYALDANTGQEKWTLKTGGKVTSSPCAASGVVYVGSDDGCLYALH
jgi:outer membrane protein assembly factor BamB